MSTTKPSAPDEDKNYVMQSSMLIENPKNVEDNRKKSLLYHYVNNNFPIKSYNFIKSKFGEIRYNTKLSLENSVKEHCISRCLIKEGENLHQAEKLCMSNCITEGVNFIEGFYYYKHKDYLNQIENRNYSVESSLPIKRI